MKTPLSWISVYTPLESILKEKSITELAHLYSIHTAEIDDILTHDLDKIVIGKVISCEKHPDSKKLSIVRVFLGEKLGEETILTGAENIINAKYVPVATVGAVLGEDFVIGERKMAGMISRGMICGDNEIGLVSEVAAGIMILEEIWDEKFLETMVGKSVFDLSIDFPGISGKIVQIPLRDTTFEIDNKFITNRPDLFSVIGNAREWATIFDENFTNPLPLEATPTQLSNKILDVSIESDKCLAYTLLETDNLTAEKSPLAIRMMMERAGLNPKLDLADITNMILTEYGQPMHAFDADKIVGKISVRMAKNGEKIEALNDETYELTDKDLVIADESGPIAIAGVIGGKNSAVSETTTRVFWESATFDATSVRLTAQRHSIRTDASTRYEKSLDPTLALKPFPRVLKYLEFLGKNPEIKGQFSGINTDSVREIDILVPFALVEQKSGIKIPQEKIFHILQKLGFVISDITEENFSVHVPSWRASKDINIPEDIVEEILRIYGYENIPVIALSGDFSIQAKNFEISLTNRILSFFSARGWNEVYNYSFTNLGLEKKILSENHDQLIAIQNTYTEDFTHMRTSLAPRLFINIAENLRHQDNLKFFEIGKIYAKNLERDSKIEKLLAGQENLPFPERTKIAGSTTSETIASLRNLLDALFVELFGFIPAVSQGASLAPFLHPGVCGEYSHDGILLAKFGKIHPQVVENFEIPDSTIYFEIDFEAIFQLEKNTEKHLKPISVYQPITRELNFLLPKHTEIGSVAHKIEAVHPWISRVVVDDIFEDAEKIGENMRSVNFSFVVQSPDSTISDEEAKNIQESIIQTIADAGYKLRGM